MKGRRYVHRGSIADLPDASKTVRKEVPVTRIIFIVCLASFIIFIFLRNLWQIDLPDIWVVAISAIVFSLLPVEYNMVFFAFLVPFKTGIGMHSIALLYCIASFIRHLRKKGGTFDAPIILMVVLTVLETINATMGSGDYPEVLRYAVYLYWMYFVYEQLNDLLWDKQIISNIIKAFITGLVIASLIIVIINGKNLTLTGLLGGQYRIGKTAQYSSLNSMLISFHVNDLAIFCGTGIALTVILILNRCIKTIIGSIGVIYLLLVGFLTQSRTFVVMLAFLVVYLALVSGKSRWKYLFAISVVAVFILILYDAGHLPVIDTILLRFNSTDMATMNGRTDIINAYSKVILSNPIRFFTGYGVSDYQLYSTVASAHNGTQETLVSCGLIGTFCIVYWYYFLGRTAQQQSKCKIWNNLTNYAPFLMLLLGIQGTQFVSQYHMFCLFTIALISVALRTNRGLHVSE